MEGSNEQEREQDKEQDKEQGEGQADGATGLEGTTATTSTEGGTDEKAAEQDYVAWVPIGEANLVRVHQLLESIAHRERDLVTQIQQLLAPV